MEVDSSKAWSGIGKKISKNGSTVYKIYNVPIKVLLTLFVDDRKRIQDVIYKATTDKVITSPVVHKFQPTPKSFSIFVHETKVVMMPYVLTMKQGPDGMKPNVSSSERLVFSFRKNRLFIYWLKMGKKRYVNNLTFKFEQVDKWIRNEYLRYADKKDSQRRASFLANLLLNKAVECGILRKKPGKNLRNLRNTLSLLLFPNFQDYCSEGYAVTSLWGLKEFPDVLRNKNLGAYIKKFFKIRGKKKGLIREALAAAKMTLKCFTDSSYLTKRLDLTPVNLSLYIYKSTGSLDQVQNFLKEVQKIFSNAIMPLPDSCIAYTRGMNSLRETLSKSTDPNMSIHVAFLQKFHPNTQIRILLDIIRDHPYHVETKNKIVKENGTIMYDVVKYTHDVNFPHQQYDLFKDAVFEWNDSIAKGAEIALDFDFADLKELHDKISVQYRRIKDLDYAIPVPDRARLLEEKGPDKDGWAAIFPKSKYQLSDWGAELNHCIASYAQRAKDKTCLLIGIVKDKKLTYTLEIDKSGRVNQFYGKNNQRPVEEDRVKVENILASAGITRTQLGSEYILGTGATQLAVAYWDYPVPKLLNERDNVDETQIKNQAANG